MKTATYPTIELVSSSTQALILQPSLGTQLLVQVKLMQATHLG